MTRLHHSYLAKQVSHPKMVRRVEDLKVGDEYEHHYCVYPDAQTLVGHPPRVERLECLPFVRKGRFMRLDAAKVVLSDKDGEFSLSPYQVGLAPSAEGAWPHHAYLTPVK